MKFEERPITISAGQKRALIVLNCILLGCTAVVYTLLCVSIFTDANYNMIAVATIVPFAVVYFNCRKFISSLDDGGICPRWAKITAKLHPIIYLIGFVFSIFTI